MIKLTGATNHPATESSAPAARATTYYRYVCVCVRVCVCGPDAPSGHFYASGRSRCLKKPFALCIYARNFGRKFVLEVWFVRSRGGYRLPEWLCVKRERKREESGCPSIMHAACVRTRVHDSRKQEFFYLEELWEELLRAGRKEFARSNVM